ncbi:MAG: PAS domain-containing protein [Spirochaetales bacterium]|nr:PAS domain-containing protein [Spirochaetales bacterium]
MIGILPQEIIDALLETIPLEFSIIDKNDNVLAWNKHESRIFRRPAAVVGKNVKACHPQKSLDKVEKIIAEMKSGIRDKARFWIDLALSADGEKDKVLIEYYALRNPDGEYLGCLEASQNISEIQKLKDEHRLLD